MKKILSIGGMTCKHCVKRVEDALGGLGGVKKVKVDLNKKIAVIEIESEASVTDDLLGSAVKDAGYELIKIE